MEDLKRDVRNASFILSSLLLFLILLCAVPIAQAARVQATIVRIKGTVLVLPQKGGNWVAGHKWMKISSQAQVRTLSASFCDLLIGKRVLVRIKSQTQIQVSDLKEEIAKSFEKALGERADFSDSGTWVRILKGKALFLVAPKFKGLPLVVETPIGMAGVKGTRFVVDLTAPRTLYVAVWEGRVVVWNPAMPEKAVSVTHGTISTLAPGELPVIPRKMTPLEKQRYKEVEKLHLGLELFHKSRGPGSRYKGRFSRGYAPGLDIDYGAMGGGMDDMHLDQGGCSSSGMGMSSGTSSTGTKSIELGAPSSCSGTSSTRPGHK